MVNVLKPNVFDQIVSSLGLNGTKHDLMIKMFGILKKRQPLCSYSYRNKNDLTIYSKDAM